MPEDDVDVVYLLKRGLSHLDPRFITVVEHVRRGAPRSLEEHTVGKRYLGLFGNKIDWHTEGFKQWASKNI